MIIERFSKNNKKKYIISEIKKTYTLVLKFEMHQNNKNNKEDVKT